MTSLTSSPAPRPQKSIGAPHSVIGQLLGLVLLIGSIGCYESPMSPRHSLVLDAPVSLRGAKVTLDNKAVGALYPPFGDNALFALFERVATGPEPAYAKDQHRVGLHIRLDPLLRSAATHTVTIALDGKILEHAFRVDPAEHPSTIGIAVVDGGMAEFAIDDKGQELYEYDQCRSEGHAPRRDQGGSSRDPTPNPSLQRTPPG